MYRVRWRYSPESDTREPGSKHGQDKSRPDHGPCMRQDLAKLVPSVLQYEVQERKDDKWEEPGIHAGVIHLCTVEIAK